MKIKCRIIINDKITDDELSKKQILKLYSYGAIITVYYDGLIYDLENKTDYNAFNLI